MNQTHRKIAEMIKARINNKALSNYQRVVSDRFFIYFAKELADYLCKTEEEHKEFLKLCGVDEE